VTHSGSEISLLGNIAPTIKVVSLDPGKTTGWACATIAPDKPIYLDYDQRMFSHAQLFRFLDSHSPDFVVCESFEYRNRQRDNLELISREYIGVAKLYCEIREKPRLCMQTAAQGKGFFNDTKLRQMKLHQSSPSHGRDAARHLLHWFNFGGGYKFNTKQPIALKR
jgi:hypothetical protein